MGELHRVIARQIALKPTPLKGQEVRFLRKSAGFRAKDFATLMGATPAHLSRVENGKTAALGASSDRSARAVAMAAHDGEYTRQILLRLAEAIETHRFRLVSNHWRIGAAERKGRMPRSKRSQSKHDAEVRRIAKGLEKQGFEVEADVKGFRRPETIEGYRPDVVGIRGNERRIVEVETPDSVDKARDVKQQQAFRRAAQRSTTTTFQRKVTD